MRRERVSEDIYIFTSDLYAQVTASVILTEEGAIVIDTLPLPAESMEMADFVSRRSRRGARFVINTHFHADHVYGNYFYPEAEIIGHQRCREMLLEFGEEQLRTARAETPALADVQLVPPEIVFNNEMGLHLAGRSLRLMHLPGHTPDGIGALVDGERILFAGDGVMPLPYFVWGERNSLKRTLQRIHEIAPESIVQGHGELLLRG
ncbi:MAG TPA: MBL fold metallo-hydrolase, partial [Ardenticatenaceae bacterium]|nr:MBL fold metallo-hydrolase [Ardenticatenaceae bacterium]